MEQLLPEIPWDLPKELIYGWGLLTLLLGDLIKRFGYEKWVIPINAIAAVIVTAAWFQDFSVSILFMGLAIGLAPTGIHRLLKQWGVRK